jgi:hypothetical protein
MNYGWAFYYGRILMLGFAQNNSPLTAVASSSPIYMRALCWQIYWTVLARWRDLKDWISWPDSASELCRPSDRRLSVKSLLTFADRRCRVVCVTGTLRPYSRLSRPEPLLQYFLPSSSSIVLKRLSGPRPNPLLLGISGSAANRTRTSGSVSNNSDH